MKNKKAYLLKDVDPFMNADDPNIAISLSLKDLIRHVINLGMVDERTYICPDGRNIRQLGEYLPTWKTELCLLSMAEFNDWFENNLEIDVFPLI